MFNYPVKVAEFFRVNHHPTRLGLNKLLLCKKIQAVSRLWSIASLQILVLQCVNFRILSFSVSLNAIMNCQLNIPRLKIPDDLLAVGILAHVLFDLYLCEISIIHEQLTHHVTGFLIYLPVQLVSITLVNVTKIDWL